MPPQAADQHGDASLPRTDTAATERLIIASNRGPFSFAVEKGGRLQVTGGPSPVPHANQTTWVSVAATAGERAAAEQAGDDAFTTGLPEGTQARLITPSRRALHRYYNVICNPLLWFLHHRSWGFSHTPNIDREAHTAWEQGFVNVSRMVAGEIVDEAERADPHAAVLLREYHMHLVAGMVREGLPGATIRYAPAVPWPGPTDWMLLPAQWRNELFSSLLGCDAIELTSELDVRSFLACMDEFTDSNIDRSKRQVTAANGHILSVEVKHPTIDVGSLHSVADSNRCETYVGRFTEDSRYTFVTTDRTEPHKNIVRSIRAFGSLLDQDRSLTEDARYLIVLAPPPPHLSQYRRYQSEIEKATRDVNSRHSAGAGKPVELRIENNYPMALAAMTAADTLVSVPIADATCATQLSTPLINRNNSTFILSETSTAAELFRDAAELVAASDVEAIKNAMLMAVDMPAEERESRFAKAESIAYDHEQE